MYHLNEVDVSTTITNLELGIIIAVCIFLVCIFYALDREFL